MEAPFVKTVKQPLQRKYFGPTGYIYYVITAVKNHRSYYTDHQRTRLIGGTLRCLVKRYLVNKIVNEAGAYDTYIAL